MVIFGSGGGGGENIVDIDTGNDGASRRATYIHTPFAAEVDKVPTEDGPVDAGTDGGP